MAERHMKGLMTHNAHLYVLLCQLDMPALLLKGAQSRDLGD